LVDITIIVHGIALVECTFLGYTLLDST